MISHEPPRCTFANSRDRSATPRAPLPGTRAARPQCSLPNATAAPARRYRAGSSIPHHRRRQRPSTCPVSAIAARQGGRPQALLAQPHTFCASCQHVAWYVCAKHACHLSGPSRHPAGVHSARRPPRTWPSTRIAPFQYQDSAFWSHERVIRSRQAPQVPSRSLSSPCTGQLMSLSTCISESSPAAPFALSAPGRAVPRAMGQRIFSAQMRTDGNMCRGRWRYGVAQPVPVAGRDRQRGEGRRARALTPTRSCAPVHPHTLQRHRFMAASACPRNNGTVRRSRSRRRKRQHSHGDNGQRRHGWCGAAYAWPHSARENRRAPQVQQRTRHGLIAVGGTRIAHTAGRPRSGIHEPFTRSQLLPVLISGIQVEVPVVMALNLQLGLERNADAALWALPCMGDIIEPSEQVIPTGETGNDESAIVRRQGAHALTALPVRRRRQRGVPVHGECMLLQSGRHFAGT